MPLGDDLDGPVDHFNGGLVVDRVRRTRQTGRPAFRVLHLFNGRSSLSTCGKIEKSTMPSVSSPPVGGFQPTKSSPILGVITMLPALSPTQTVSSIDGRSCQPRLPHPVAQV